MRYKASMYNFEIQDGCNMVIYNGVSDQLLVINQQLYDFYYTNKEHLENIESKHKDFFGALVQLNFIVPENSDERESLMQFWEKEDNSDEKFTITLNPTLDCNLRCWYCYEKHCKTSNMSSKVLNSVEKLVLQKVGNHKLKTLSYSFFGGEPFLQFDKIIKPLIIFSSEQCNNNNVDLHLSFTTNLVLVDQGIINFLKYYNDISPIFWQVTLDGNREIHDQVKFSTKMKSTYDIIISNIKKLIEAKMGICVRLNYTAETLNSFPDIISEFKEFTPSQRKMLQFDFHRVWQDRVDVDDLSQKVNQIKEWFRQEGLSVKTDLELSQYRCYADKQNSVVINHNGDIFKCTARDFKHEMREGELLSDGTIIYNQLYNNRMKVKFINDDCKNCIIFPLCAGGCSQCKLETTQTRGCLRGYDERKKIDLIDKHISELLMLNRERSV